MIIQVEQSVLDNERWYPVLDAVVSILEMPHTRHTFDVTQYAKLKNSRWLSTANGLRANAAESIRASAKAASRDVPSDAVRVRIDDLAPQGGETLPESVIRINPLGALTILMQPLHLIVEDESSDGGFVLWMARLLGRDTVRLSYTAGRLLFRHAGGKGQLAKSAAALTFGVWPRDNRPILSCQLRVIALLDSDARFPGDAPNAQIVKSLKPHVAHTHMLRGRSIENYVPYKYARRRMDRERLGAMADAYNNMTEDQRNHFRVRRGCVDRAAPPNPQSHAAFLADAERPLEERDLYRSVSPHDWAQFAGGFGNRLADVFQDPYYRCEPSEMGLLTPSQHAELNDLLTRVIRYL
jgi:hypothetical protein